MTINKTLAGIGLVVVAMLLIVFFAVGNNTQGYRVVGQYITGETYVKITPGPYFTGFGKSWRWPNEITFDYDQNPATVPSTLDIPGIAVRYKDGGEGSIYGVTRFSLPADEQSMLEIQQKFRSVQGLATKLLAPTVTSVMNNTAGLMDSDESYAERRGEFAQMARDQIKRGPYAVELIEEIKYEDGKEYCAVDNPDMAEELKRECRSAKREKKMRPVVVKTDSGQPVTLSNDIKDYNISVPVSKVIAWDYEKKTLDQIALKREETMASITAKAAAERAKADTLKAIEEGKRNVATAQYEKEVEKAKAVVLAQQRVEVAREARNEAEQKALAAIEYKKEQILIGEGDAERKRLVIEADGALAQKLETYEKVNSYYAEAVGKQKWVPEVNMGGTGGPGGNGNSGDAAQQLIDMLSVKTAKDLSLDMKIK